ncbi:unnamed protein product [Closterium sp. NIES-53]
MAPGQQASAVDMAVEGAEDEEEEGLEAATSTEAAGVADTAMITRTTDAVADSSTASVIFATRADTCGAIATSSQMDGLLLKAKRVEEQEEGEEEAVKAVAVAEVVLQRAEVKGMGKAMFKSADGKMVGLKNVLWVPNLAANLISVRRLQKAGMDTSSKGAKTYTARLGERILWDLHEDRDVYNEMWQIPVVPMPKERQVAASISTKGEAALTPLLVCGGPTAWESKKQVDQALSSVESEYMALFRAVREIVWQRRLLAKLGEEQQGPTPLYCDSQGAIALAKNPVLHGLTKHMRVKWHWTRSTVAAGEVELHYVKTTGQPADMMTKRLVEQEHWKCCKLAGMALN